MYVYIYIYVIYIYIYMCIHMSIYLSICVSHAELRLLPGAQSAPWARGLGFPGDEPPKLRKEAPATGLLRLLNGIMIITALICICMYVYIYTHNTCVYIYICACMSVSFYLDGE